MPPRAIDPDKEPDYKPDATQYGLRKAFFITKLGWTPQQYDDICGALPNGRTNAQIADDTAQGLRDS